MSTGSLSKRVRCPICAWRNAVLPALDTDDSDAEECHTPVLQMQRHTQRLHIEALRHERPLDPWVEILIKHKLCSGSPAFGGPLEPWFRWPLRNMLPLANHAPFNDHIMGGSFPSELRSHDGSIFPGSSSCATFTTYHFLKVEYLVRGHEWSPGSNGVFYDAAMRYGSRHTDGTGVYMFSYFPADHFTAGDGWVLLELKCVRALTKVAGGSAGRCLLKGPEGQISRLVEPIALYAMRSQVVPAFCCLC